MVLNLSSDAAVEAYETWGGYGSSKAGVDDATRVLAAEEPALRVYAVSDPGDMRTRLHQDAFPGEDISDRPEPETVPVPGLLRLIEDRPASGRYRGLKWVGARMTGDAKKKKKKKKKKKRASAPAAGARRSARDEVRMAVVTQARDPPPAGQGAPALAGARRPARRQHQRDAALGPR